MTAGERAYTDYFQQRQGLNSEGQPLPTWAELPDPMKAWWDAAGLRPPGGPAWWATIDFWVNAAVIVMAAVESQVGVLKELLPGSIFVYVAPALLFGNTLVKVLRLGRAAQLVKQGQQ